MDDFLTKPVRQADLGAAIERVLKARPERPSPRLDLVDAELLRKMCQSLKRRVPEHLAALENAWRERDAPRLREAAHQSCGMLSEFSTVAGDLAGNLEDLAAAGQLDNVAVILEQLERIARELVKQIDGITVDALCRQAEATDQPGGTAGPSGTGP